MRIVWPCLLWCLPCQAELPKFPDSISKPSHHSEKFLSSGNGRKLKGRPNSHANKHAQVVKNLKSAIAKLTEEKTTLSNEVKASARDAANKARQVSELTSEVSAKEKEIAKLKSEVAKKNPACSDNATLSAERTVRLAEEGARQQKEIANLTAQLSAMKIRYRILEEEFGDPSLQFFLTAKATKVYQDPGIQGAANKTFKYVLPHVSDALKTGTEVYSAMNSSVLEGMHSLLGSDSSVEPWLPLASAFLVYGMICCPIGIVLSYLVEFVCSIREVLLACGFYLVCVSCLSCGFIAATQRDPLKELALNDPSVLLLQQLGFAGIMVFYLVMLGISTCGAACDENLPFFVIVARLIQVSFLIVFALTYYRLVWTPTMLDEMPMVEELFSRDKTASVLPYLLTMAGFGGNLWLEWRAGAAEKVAAQEEKEVKDA